MSVFNSFGFSVVWILFFLSLAFIPILYDPLLFNKKTMCEADKDRLATLEENERIRKAKYGNVVFNTKEEYEQFMQDAGVGAYLRTHKK